MEEIDQKAHDFRRAKPGLLTQNRAVIEFHKYHQSRPAEALMGRTLQFGEGPCTVLVALKNSPISGCPTAALSAATAASNSLEDVTLSRSISTFSMGFSEKPGLDRDEVQRMASRRQILVSGSKGSGGVGIGDEFTVKELRKNRRKE